MRINHKKIAKYAAIVLIAGTIGWFIRSYKSHTMVIYQANQHTPFMNSYEHPVEPSDTPESKKYIFYGGANIENKVFKNLKIFGSAQIQHSIIKNNASVFGALHTKDSTYRHLSINGALRAETTSIQYALINGAVAFTHVRSADMLSINGSFKARFSELNNVEVTASSLKIKDSKIKNLYIHPPSPLKNTPQSLYISGQSVLDTVTFENGMGEVYVQGDDVKIHKLQGGKIINHI